MAFVEREPTRIVRHAIFHSHSTTTNYFLLVNKGWFLTGNIHGGHNIAQLGHALGVSSFVIVPRVNLDHAFIDDLSGKCVHDTTTGIVGVIRRDEWFRFVTENTFEWSFFTGLFECFVDFFHGNVPLDFKDTVRQACIEEWYPNGESVEFSFEFGVDLDNGSGGSGTGGAEVHHTGSGPPQVGLFSVGHVDNGLRTGDIVDGSNATPDDTKVFLNDFYDWC